jgi:hypothetical protein
MGTYNLTNGETYRLGRVNGNAVIIDGSDFANAELFIRNDLFVTGAIKASGSDANEGGQLELHPPIGGGYRWILDNYQEKLRLFHEGTSVAVRLLIEADTGDVGIGTESPLGRLHVHDDNNTTPFRITTEGNVGVFQWNVNSTSGYTATHTLNDDAYEIGHGSSIRDVRFLTNDTARVTIEGGGNVGIGTTTPDEFCEIKQSVASGYVTQITNNYSGGSSSHVLKLRMNEVSVNNDSANVFIGFHNDNDTLIAAIYADTNENRINITEQASDILLKENIKDTKNPTYSLDNLLKLKVRDFTWKEEQPKHSIKSRVAGRSETGYIAQELLEHYPEGVLDFTDFNKKEGLKPGDKDYKYMFLNNRAPNPLLVKAIQDQQKIIESLEKRIVQLENRK